MRQMAHPARPSIRDHRRPRRPAGRDPRGPRRFLGPAILAVAVVLILAATALDPGDASAGRAAGVPDTPAGGPGPSSATRPVAPLAGATVPPCTEDDLPAPKQGPDDWAWTILDTAYRLDADARPPDLVPVTDAGIEGRGKVRSLVVGDLRALAAAAAADGADLVVASAYRSYEQQVASYASYVHGYSEAEARRTVARPGHSEHQLGTTLDFEGDLAWLEANAWRFGFVMSYPEASSPARTCYRHEAWHWRYVGRDAAAQVRASGLSLREWLWRNRP